MVSRAYLLLPLIASLLYVVGAVYLKRATQGGVGMWRAALVSNAVSAVIFLPLLFLGGADQPWGSAWQPAIVAALLVVGQCASLWALSRGDVSVATPVMGAKVILVAFFTTVVADLEVPLRLWLAAILSAVALGVLNRGQGGRHHDLTLTVIGAMVAAAAFALFDVLVMMWSPIWGAGRLLPLSMGLAAVYSLAFVPLFRVPRGAVPRSAWLLLLGGALLIGVQGLLLITTLALFGNATAVNIVYGTRGVWSVLLVWVFGRQLGAAEAGHGPKVLGWRLVGAGLMTAAVLAVFF